MNFKNIVDWVGTFASSQMVFFVNVSNKYRWIEKWKYVHEFENCEKCEDQNLLFLILIKYLCIMYIYRSNGFIFLVASRIYVSYINLHFEYKPNRIHIQIWSHLAQLKTNRRTIDIRNGKFFESHQNEFILNSNAISIRICGRLLNNIVE